MSKLQAIASAGKVQLGVSVKVGRHQAVSAMHT